jgi:hypothetical protein
VVSTSASGVAWRLGANAFTGREREGDDIPPWVCEAVLRGLLPYVKELKSAFVLLPAEGSGLPSLLQSRLNAPRILQVMKVRHRGMLSGGWLWCANNRMNYAWCVSTRGSVCLTTRNAMRLHAPYHL